MALTERQHNFRTLVWNATGYTPSVEQNIFHKHPARLKQVAGGVGAGKSFSAAREVDAYTVIENGLGWIIGPDYEQCKPEFDYLFEPYTELGIIDEGSVSRPTRGTAKFATTWGFKWETKSAGDPVSIASRRPDVVLLAEAAQQPHEMYFKALERATEKNAPVIFSGTFESSLGWYADLWERWQGSNPEGGKSFSIPTWSNLEVYPGGRDDPKIKSIEASMPPELFLERYGGVPCKPSGLVFKEFERKTHCKPLAELYNPDLPIELWIDPATHTYPCLFVQLHPGGRVHILDEIYCKNEIAQQVIPKVVSHRFWEHVHQGVMDIAGSFRQGANKSQIEVWSDETQKLKTHGIDWEFLRVKDAMEWYNALHLRLHNPADGEPLLYFADHLRDDLGADGNANGVIGEIKSHRWPDRSERTALPGRPTKRNEDALSAIGYGLLVHFGPVVERAKVKREVKRRYWN